jgi:hypothetical protein
MLAYRNSKIIRRIINNGLDKIVNKIDINNSKLYEKRGEYYMKTGVIHGEDLVEQNDRINYLKAEEYFINGKKLGNKNCEINLENMYKVKMLEK